MIIRRYLGRDSAEAMQKVKSNLGSDAIILNTRKIRKKGLLRIFSKPYVEILAAVDQDMNASKKNIKEKTEQPTISQRFNSSTLKESIAPAAVNENENEISKLENKVRNMENILNEIYSQIRHKDNKKEDKTDHKKVCENINMNSSNENNESNANKYEFINEQSKLLQLFATNLINNSVDMEIIKEIISNSKKQITDESDINEVQSCIYDNLVSVLGTPKPLEIENDNNQKVIVFLGPTGVGKTTTLAKIAAIYSVNNNADIGIISADTYRIAAVEQLKTYAKILKLPVKVVYSPDEIPSAIEAFNDKDLILIDTAGSSHKNPKLFDEIKNIVNIADPDEIFLLISLTTDNKVCKEIIESYSFLKNYKIICTKLDEAATSGIILNIRKLTQKNLSYITNGQSVPDDIFIADSDELANRMLGSF